jgi:hypothetical protein
MSVPETTMHEDRYAMLWENEVGAPRQISPVYAIAQAHSEGGPPNKQFSSRGPLANARHQSAPLGRRGNADRVISFWYAQV